MAKWGMLWLSGGCCGWVGDAVAKWGMLWLSGDAVAKWGCCD